VIRILRGVAVIALLTSCGGGVRTVRPVLVPPVELQDFGTVPVLNAKTVEVPVENVGRAMLTVHSVTILDAGTPFTIVERPFEVGTSERKMIIVRFVPPEEQQYETKLELKTDDEANPTVIVQLIGRGSTRAIMEVEPAAIDFGRVAEGTSAVKSIVVRSKGTADLILEGIAFTEGSSPAFEFLGSVSTPAVVPREAENGLPGQINITIRYTVAEGTTGSFTANVRLQGTDPDRREVIVPVTGQVNRAPIPNIAPLGVGSPGREVDLDARGSTDPDDDYPLTYRWTLRSKPLGATTTISGPEQPQTQMVLDPELPGEYVVELNVVDAAGARNLAPARATIVAAPAQKLLVEMFWDNTVPDIDLHFMRSTTTTLGTVPDDCFYQNPNPDWGASGDSSDDPQLVRDALTGYGPEVVGYVNPPEGKYRVVAEYRNDHFAQQKATEITVRIYEYGVVQFEQKKVLSDVGEVWGVADIEWPSGEITALEP
jgi:hypothetical protein